MSLSHPVSENHLTSMKTEEAVLYWDLPTSPVVKTPPSNVGGVGVIPGQGTRGPTSRRVGPKMLQKKKKPAPWTPLSGPGSVHHLAWFSGWPPRLRITPLPHPSGKFICWNLLERDSDVFNQEPKQTNLPGSPA